MRPSYYLWSGIRDIEDLDDDETLYDPTYGNAMAALRAKTHGDWSLWERVGDRVRLVAVSVERDGNRRVIELHNPKERV